jgi:hypothetical protein
MTPNTTSDTKTAEAQTANGRTAALPVIERLEYGLPRPMDEAALRPALGSSALPAFQSVTSKNFGSFTSSQPEGEAAVPTPGGDVNWAQVAAELEARLARENMEARQAIAAAREEGRREGQHAAEAGLNADQQRNQARVMAALEAFRLERQKYFKDVEREVVRLALAIAARYCIERR